jgi:hypothetical protein
MPTLALLFCFVLFPPKLQRKKQKTSRLYSALRSQVPIKPMNQEEEEAPLEDPCVRRNRLAQERHTLGLKKINTV